MQRQRINLDNLPSSIKEFFTPEEFANIPEYEKQHLSSLRQNFEALKRTGLTVQPPEFMIRNKSEAEKGKLMSPSVSDSSDGSDSEWTPAVEIVKKRSDERYQPLCCQRKAPHTDIRGFPENKGSLPSCGQKRKLKCTRTAGGAEVESDDEEPHVYPFRKTRMKSYMSLHIPDDDDFLYCEECNMEYDGDCPVHGALLAVNDSKVPASCQLGIDPEYCRKTLPPGLVIKKSYIPQAGLGVFAVQDFPVRTRFGPYQGKKEKHEEIAQQSGYCWQICTDGKAFHFVDACDPRDSNWMRFVNCARSEDEQCVTAYQHHGEIYYRAHRDIKAGTEILVYYGDSYAKDLGIQMQTVGKQSQNRATNEGERNHLAPVANSNEIFSCNMCYLAFSDPSYLQKHIRKMHHYEYCEQQNNSEPTRGIHKGSHQEQRNTTIARNNRVYSSMPTICNMKVPRLKAEKLNCVMSLPGENHLTEQNTGQHITRDCSVSSIPDVKQFQNIPMCSSTSVESNKYKNFNAESRQKSIYMEEKPYKCSICDVSFACTSHLKEHTRTHTGEKPYKCDVCGVGFARTGNLKRHKRKHTGEKPYKCDVCGVGFAQTGNLKRHKRKHTGEKPYKCDVCGVGFAETGNLKMHKRKHTGEKPYKWDVCGVGFAQTGHLKMQKRKHTGEKPYKCDVCGVGFAETGNLKMHKRKHTGEKPYKCDVCGVGFAQTGNLKMHKRKHTGEKPYKCDVCGVGFAQTGNLKMHKRKHTGEKPYKCDVCGVGFAQTGNLKMHKRKHTGEKPYKCDVCGVGFAQTGHLKRHKRMHTGEKPYKCDVCGVSFAQTSNLKKH